MKQRHMLHLLHLCGLKTIFLIAGLGIEDQQWPQWSPELIPYDFFVGLSQRGSLVTKTKNTRWTETTNLRYFTTNPLDLERVLSLSFRLQECVQNAEVYVEA